MLLAIKTAGPRDSYSPALSIMYQVTFSEQSMRELNRLGCDAGAADGIWGSGSQKALQSYVRFAKVDLASLDPPVVVTAYRTSRIGKYRRKT